VTYGKGALIGKMPGDEWQRNANLRSLYGYMYGHPGKKLLFMGAEFGQWREWWHEESLEWHSLQYPFQQGVRKWVEDLNRVYRREPALHEIDFGQQGFEWVDFHNWEESIISFLRKGRSSNDVILVVCNFTPLPRKDYRVGVPRGGFWREILNSDAHAYGGSNLGNAGGVEASLSPAHGRSHSLSVTLPPLAVLFFKNELPSSP
jgi:1,4-alpha-glucan branching enzyme